MKQELIGDLTVERKPINDVATKRKLIFEKSKDGHRGYSLPQLDVPGGAIEELLPKNMLRDEDPGLPEVDELTAIRHYTRLSQMNYSVDTGFYPLGSCTMKYNPKVNEKVARLEGLVHLHPYQLEEEVQGALEVIYTLERLLSEITGMYRGTLQPAAGAHGELTGMLIIRAHQMKKGEKRTKVLVPDSAHGTNLATAKMCGYSVVELKSNQKGQVDLKLLEEALDKDVAAFMLTNPNTLGLFEENVIRISEMVHRVGGLLYLDGANMNAIMGYARPRDMGFDVVHLNLHKTFSTPHGGGGPGSGPIFVTEELEPYLPVPVVERRGGHYALDYDRPLSIGRVKAFYGNFNVFVKALAYILAMGAEGLKQASFDAVLNANYLKEKLKKSYYLPYDFPCMHEFVLSGEWQAKKGVKTLDIAKRLMDFGFHPPTVYFPLIVKEALMIEPTETESKDTLDAFAEAMIKIAQEADSTPETVQSAPATTPIGRPDEVRAARNPVLRWKP